MSKERVGRCPALGIVRDGAIFDRKGTMVVVGDNTVGCPIKPKRREIVRCPIDQSGSGIFACGDCGFYVVKQELKS